MTTVVCTDGGARLDVFLTDETDMSRSHIKNLIDGGKVTVCGVTASKAGQIVKVGDEVAFDDEVAASEVLPQDIPLDVIYDDDDVAVINKPRGLVVHPGAGNHDGTLVNALLYRYGNGVSSVYGKTRAGIVHRLDKDTTGLMVVAKTDLAHLRLGEQFACHSVKKLYRAILDGNLKSDGGTVDAAVGRDKKNRLKMAVSADGRRAVTKYTVLERFKSNCYAEFELCTGRTHQIRVHCAYLHHPITCDALYGGSTQKFGVSGQLLHSRTLAFDHPRSGKRLEFTVSEPPDFCAVLDLLRKQTKKNNL